MQRNTKYYSENKNITNNKIKYEVFKFLNINYYFCKYD